MMRRQKTDWSRRAAMALLFFGALAALPRSAQADEKPIFGEISGVSCKGASDGAFPGFAVASFSFGDTNVSTIGSATGGAGAGKVTFQDISITKGLDDCTPALFEAVAKGTPSSTASLTVVQKGTRLPILKIQLSHVVVTSDKFVEGAANELDEVITLAYSQITITHVPSGKSVIIDVNTLTVQ